MSLLEEFESLHQTVSLVSDRTTDFLNELNKQKSQFVSNTADIAETINDVDDALTATIEEKLNEARRRLVNLELMVRQMNRDIDLLIQCEGETVNSLPKLDVE